MKKHLAIFTPSVLDQILNGRKTIESRFSQKRMDPYGKIEVGDIVYCKPTGGEISAQFRVTKVIYIEGLTKNDLELIRKEYGEKISLGSKEIDDKFFKDKETANFGTLIFFDTLEKFIVSPVKIEKRDKRAWVVLE